MVESTHQKPIVKDFRGNLSLVKQLAYKAIQTFATNKD